MKPELTEDQHRLLIEYIIDKRLRESDRMRRLRRPRPHQHDWFPNHLPREFIVTMDTCMKCDAVRIHMPWGTCIGGHPLAEHYDADGTLVRVPACTVGIPW